MEEAVDVSVSVAPLVPPARLGALMVETRTSEGIALDEMARRSAGIFTASFLENAERGRAVLDDGIVAQLVGLYQVNAGLVIPERSELILDLDRQHLSVGSNSISFDSLHTDDVLERYVALVYMMRGLDYGSELVLRDRDLDVLSESLGREAEDLRKQILGLIEAPDSVQRAKSVSKGKMVMAAGILVGVTAIGTLVLVGVSRNDSPTEVLGASQTFVTSGFPFEMGNAAEATVEYDFRSALPGWQIGYAEDNPDFLGVTLSEERSITVHVESYATVETVAAVLMHEVGHAIDLEYLDDQMRAEWIDMRNMPAAWWPGNGLNDFSVGAGDFAEAVSALTTGSASSSAYGEFTQDQLDFVASVLDNT